MARPDSDHDLLQTIIADISATIDPLPGPTEEVIASIVIQDNVQYLQDRVTELESQDQELRNEIAALREQNSILRFENDTLHSQESAKQEYQATSPATPNVLSTDLIDLGPNESSTLAAPRVEDNTHQEVRTGKANQLKSTESQATDQPEAKTPDRKEKNELLTPGRQDNPVVIEDDEDSPVKQLSFADESRSTIEQYSPSTINNDTSPVAEANDQNTSLVLKELPPNTNYRDLLQAISTIRPGRIKEVHIRDGNSASITFFTREAAEKLHAAFQKARYLNEGRLLYSASASWSSKHILPEDPMHYTRVLGVGGHPDCVNVTNVLSAVRSQGFNPQMESIILTPPQTFLRHDSSWCSPRQQVICRFRSVRDAERVFEILARAFPVQWRSDFQYLLDPCE